MLCPYVFYFLTSLFQIDICSDITIKYGTQKRRGHKFVLAARSSVWLELDMTNREEIEMEGDCSLKFLKSKVVAE